MWIGTRTWWKLTNIMARKAFMDTFVKISFYYDID